MASPVKLTIIGGDSREVHLAEHLQQRGYQVSLCGFDKHPALPAENIADPVAATRDAAAVILPLAGLDENCQPRSRFCDNPPRLDAGFFQALPAGIAVFIGWAREEVRRMAQGTTLVEIGEDDELAILNSIPTAEGAVALAMANSPVTIHGSRSLVTGFGRCAVSLARMLAAIGSRVTVVARNAAQRARAHEMGLEAYPLDAITDHISRQHFVFNTVPALVLSGSVLSRATSCHLVVDIASAPGGTDFKAAEQMGLKAMLAPGLPGKVAPLSAGQILAQVFPRLLQQHGVTGRLAK